MKFIEVMSISGGVLLASSALISESVFAQSVSPTGISRERTMLTNQIRTLKNALKSRTTALQNNLDTEVARLTPPVCPASELPNWKGSSWQCETLETITGGTKMLCHPNAGQTCPTSCLSGIGLSLKACNGNCIAISCESFGGASCFPAGTQVTMANGSQKPIETVEVGDKVKGLFGMENEVLALQNVTLDNRILWDINGEVQTTADHPFWAEDGWGVLSLAEYIRNDHNVLQNVIVDDKGTIEAWNYNGITMSDMSEFGLGSRIGFKDGGFREIQTLRAHRMPPETPLYSLVLAGSHTMMLNGGYVFSGWARDDDFNYKTGQPIRPAESVPYTRQPVTA